VLPVNRVILFETCSNESLIEARRLLLAMGGIITVR
jgi:hypothetical protein